MECVDGGGEVFLLGQAVLVGHVFDQQFAELAQFDEAGVGVVGQVALGPLGQMHELGIVLFEKSEIRSATHEGM